MFLNSSPSLLLEKIQTRLASTASSEMLAVHNPADGQLVLKVPKTTAEQASSLICDATRAFEGWRQVSAYHRRQVLLDIASSIRNNSEEIASVLTLEQGKPLHESRKEVEYGASYFNWYAEEAIRLYGKTIPASSAHQRINVYKQPIGVCAAITPWNFPHAMVARKVAPALAAGCPIIVKPAQETPLSALVMQQLAHEAGLPDNLLNIIVGEAEPLGKVLLDAEVIRKISFTGSTEVGKYLYRESASTLKKLTLELGGNASLIVFDDADLKLALDGLIFAKFRNAGQTCIACNRLLLDKKISQEFIKLLVERTARLKVGDGMHSATEIGPLISKAAVRKVIDLTKSALQDGAKLLYGELPNSDSLFVSPIILSAITPAMRIFKEEVFGPVIAISEFQDESQALNLANATQYGLVNYFFTRNLNRSIRISELLQSGMVGINDCAISCSQAPFGGIKHSGFGREGGHEGIEEYLYTKYVSTNLLG